VSVFWVATGISILSFTGSGSPLDRAEKYLQIRDITEAQHTGSTPSYAVSKMPQENTSFRRETSELPPTLWPWLAIWFLHSALI
jgi:hypothetical protein